MKDSQDAAKRCAYLTMAQPDGFEVDIEMAFPPLEELGWTFEAVSWRSVNVSWDEFDAVYIGAAWDYPEEPDRFLETLESIVRSGATLINDLSLVHWTLAKTYLRELEQRGASIVPSLWFEDFDANAVEDAFDQFGSERIIIKPVISTNATDTHLLTRERAAEMMGELETTFDKRPFLIQDFIENVQGDGEYSLFFFDAVFSHAVRKVPAANDFRVQEVFGAEIVDADPGPDMLAEATKVIHLVEPRPVYARVDLVRGGEGQPLLMELELIEPSMYLRSSPTASVKFAEAFDRYYNEKNEGVTT